MMIYNWGDILLVSFPWTDADGSQKHRRRPGLVLFDEGDEDVMAAPQPTPLVESLILNSRIGKILG